MGVAYQIKTAGYVQDNSAIQQFCYSTQQELCIYWSELSQRPGWQAAHLDLNAKWGHPPTRMSTPIAQRLCK